MNRPRLYRGMKIAASAVCGVVCVLLVCLWVRSYWTVDMVSYNANTLGSQSGTVYVSQIRSQIRLAPPPRGLSAQGGLSFSLPKGWRYRTIASQPSNESFAFQSTESFTRIEFPHWILIISIAGIGSTPWLPYYRLRRFSLRTLLLITAILSGLLGLGVWLARG